MGVRYGSPEVSNAGVVDFDNGSNLWTFIGDGFPVGPIVLGAPVTGPQAIPNLARDYSVQFLVEPIPEPSGVALAAGALIGLACARRRFGFRT
jgi:hypothetical protein